MLIISWIADRIMGGWYVRSYQSYTDKQLEKQEFERMNNMIPLH